MKLDRSVGGRQSKLAPLLSVLSLALVGCDGSSTQPNGGLLEIYDLSADILRPGETFTVTGQSFASSASANEVRLHGVRLSVLDASSGSLTVRVPDFVCVPGGPAPVRVRVGDQVSEPAMRSFEAPAGLQLARGEFARITAQDGHCLLLDGAGSTAEYLVGTQRVSEVTGTQGVVLHGRIPGPGLDPASAASRSVSARGSGHGWFEEAYSFSVASSLSPPAPPHDESASAARWARHRAAESSIRAREEGALREWMAAAPTAGPGTTRTPRIPATIQPGDTVELMVPDVSSDHFCVDGIAIEGVVRRVGVRSVWVADLANPEGGFTSDDYDLLSDAFDHTIHDEVVSFFGEPTDLDSNSRIVIVISQAVNRVTEALGFVVSSDFTDPNCNYGEYYYARAPDPEGQIPNSDGETGDVYTTSQALADAPRLLAHELTHILQFGRAFTLSGASNWQPIWMLEGQATLAEEITGHRFSGYGPRQNLGGAIAFNRNYPPGRVGWYLNPFVDLAIYFGFGGMQGDQGFQVHGAPEECDWYTVLDPDPCISGRIAYGVSWSFLRWLSDHYGDEFDGGERELQQLLVTAPVRGLEAVEHVVGRDAAELLPRWAASLWADGRVPDLDPLLTFPSWNLRLPQGVEAGLQEAGHLTPSERGFTDFRTDIQVTRLSSHYQLIGGTGSHPAFAFSATGPDGAQLPGSMQLWVVRSR